MGQIHILSEEISGKIAAGEVVERPASVIKELVENSIDAGASSIIVQIRDGGISYMRVTDNGSGMLKEDAGLCFVRHATSKISSAEDLDAIYTLGFRGEALASIASVARVDIYTKKRGEEDGVHVFAEGGNIHEAESFGTPFGTNIIVQNLFFNTPARMKFLKKNTTEAGYIGDIMAKFILSHPEISIKFINGAKEVYFSSGNNKIEDCVYAVYGRDYAKNIIKMDYKVDNIRVSGIIGKSSTSRPNRGYQSFFINGRYVKSPLIARAVEEAYKNQIMIGKFPMAVVNLEINPAAIDINVHPTKLEVKFSNESAVYNAVYFTVKNALYNTYDVPNYSDDNDDKISDSAAGKLDDNRDTSDIVNEENINIVRQAAFNSPFASHSFNTNTSVEYTDKSNDIKTEEISEDEFKDEFEPKKINIDKDELRISSYESSKNIQTDAEKPKEVPYEDEYKNIVTMDNLSMGNNTNMKEDASVIEEYFFDKRLYTAAMGFNQDVSNDLLDERQNYKIIGQIFDTYIIIQKGEDIFIIDQHAAHERLKYEQLKREAQNSKITSQILLVPVIVSMTAEEYAIYSENRDLLRNIGFDIDDFGENCAAVRSTPVVLEESEIASLVIELLTYIGQSKKEIVSKRYDRMMYTIACKSAVKANHVMNKNEMCALINDVFALGNINTCPHGRPIMISMSQKQVEKKFKRIV